MKFTSLILLVLSLFIFSCNDDENDVSPNDIPEIVSNALTDTFANAMDVEWEKVGDDYEADFHVAGVDHEALLNPTGKMLKYKHDIPEAELPDAVTAAINLNYSDKHIDEAERLYKGDDIFYQVDLENSGTDVHLVFSPEGQEQSEPAYWD